MQIRKNLRDTMEEVQVDDSTLVAIEMIDSKRDRYHVQPRSRLARPVFARLNHDLLQDLLPGPPPLLAPAGH